MSQLPVPDRDTVHVWVGRGAGGRPGRAGRLLRRAGATLLGRAEAEIVVGRAPDGRPLVSASGPGGRTVALPVSVSRADGVVLVAARRAGPVGIDVERRRELPALALARRWYAPGELAWLAARPAPERAVDFLRLWTAKEAVGKALGVGLRGGGLRRPVPVPDGDDLLRPLPGRADLRVGHPAVDRDLVVAVAVAGPSGAGRDVKVLVVDADVGLVQRTGHGVAAERSASGERTSLPVVVRGS
ncbi:4'-phosphopantetheinyl transferase family protein [Micromonospora echinaurantiaca]|uniref:4'-phosphopantetheinyl transferase family protein n=1 Tax=Micromonospora echinaurantiaca TaxID=47857 RepID=UPI0037B2252C